MAREYETREFCNKKCVLGTIFSEQFIDAQICKERCVYSAWEFHGWLQKNGFKINLKVEGETREYEKREFCKRACPFEKEIQKIHLYTDSTRWVFQRIVCKKNCIMSARDFHDWLQRKGFKIIKEDE